MLSRRPLIWITVLFVYHHAPSLICLTFISFPSEHRSITPGRFLVLKDARFPEFPGVMGWLRRERVAQVSKICSWLSFSFTPYLTFAQRWRKMTHYTRRFGHLPVNRPGQSSRQHWKHPPDEKNLCNGHTDYTVRLDRILLHGAGDH